MPYRTHRRTAALLAAAALAALAPTAQAAERPYSTYEGGTQLMGPLAVDLADHLFWSVTGTSPEVKVHFPCPDGGAAAIRRVASPDGKLVWALADLPRDPNVGDVEDPGGDHPTATQVEICPAMEQAYAQARDSGPGYPASTLLRSFDGGSRWQVMAVVPSPPGRIPDSSELDLQLDSDGVRLGSPELGWSRYDAAGQPQALWQEQGVSHGVLPSLELDPQAPRPRGFDRIGARMLDDGSVVTAWATRTRVQVLHGQDGTAEQRVTSSPRFRMQVLPGAYGCSTPRRYVVRGFTEMLPGADASTVWGMTVSQADVPCPRSSLHATVAFHRALARSTDGGRTWHEVAAPKELGALVAADRGGLVAGFSSRGCRGLVAKRLERRSWRTLGCRPLYPQVSQ